MFLPPPCVISAIDKKIKYNDKRGKLQYMKNSTTKQFGDKQEFSLKDVRERDDMYNRFDAKQRAYFHAIKEHVFTFCEATTGSGKTTVSIAAALDLLANGEADRIIYVRTPDDRSLRLGFTPGTLEEKCAIYWGPLCDALLTLGITPDMMFQMVNLGLLVETTDISLRGVNFTRAVVVFDEIQNADVETMRTVFTRCHMNCHIVAAGDRKQHDNKKIDDEFYEYCMFLADSSLGNKCELTYNYRGEFSRLAESYVARKDRKKQAA